MELEVIMQEGQVIAEDLMARLGVEGSDLIDVAYMDLLESR